MFPASHSPSPVLAEQRESRHEEGVLETSVTFRPGLSLFADPSLGLGGQWRSPAGRIIELDAKMKGPGAWIGLHVTLAAQDLRQAGWIGFTCRSAAPATMMVRPCLRSGTDDGFIDVFFDKHMLSNPEPRNHVDALHLPTCRHLPETAAWRELVLFLPCADFHWHLHDLRTFVV